MRIRVNGGACGQAVGEEAAAARSAARATSLQAEAAARDAHEKDLALAEKSAACEEAAEVPSPFHFANARTHACRLVGGWRGPWCFNIAWEDPHMRFYVWREREASDSVNCKATNHRAPPRGGRWKKAGGVGAQGARTAKRGLDDEADRAARERTKRQRLEDDHRVPPPAPPDTTLMEELYERAPCGTPPLVSAGVCGAARILYHQLTLPQLTART